MAAFQLIVVALGACKVIFAFEAKTFFRLIELLATGAGSIEWAFDWVPILTRHIFSMTWSCRRLLLFLLRDVLERWFGLRRNGFLGLGAGCLLGRHFLVFAFVEARIQGADLGELVEDGESGSYSDGVRDDSYISRNKTVTFGGTGTGPATMDSMDI